MRTLILLLTLAVGLLGLSPAVPMAPCVSHGQAHAQHGQVADARQATSSAAVAAIPAGDAASVAEQERGDDGHGARLAAEGCCHAAPSLIQGAEVGPEPLASESQARPAPRDVRIGGRRPFDIFRPPATV